MGVSDQTLNSQGLPFLPSISVEAAEKTESSKPNNNTKSNKTTVSLNTAEIEALKKEAERIALAGEEWKPTYEELAKVYLNGKAASKAEAQKTHAKKIHDAQARGVKFGRKKIPIHPDFERYCKLYEEGAIKKADVIKILGVSKTTFDAWRAERQK